MSYIGKKNGNPNTDFLEAGGELENHDLVNVDSSGNLLVGKTSTSIGVQGLAVNSTGMVKPTTTNEHGLLINRLSSDGTLAEFRKDGTTVGSIKTNGGRLSITDDTYGGITFLGGSHCVAPANNAGARYDNAVDLGSGGYRYKDLYLSGGVSFDGGSNYLDDYEEGTFTPSLPSGWTSTSSNTWGRYTKIGNQVTVWTRHVNINATSSGDLTISLPFTAATEARAEGSVMANSLNVDSTTVSLVSYVGDGASAMTLYQIRDNGTWLVTTNAHINNSITDLQLTLTYRTA